MAMTAIGRAALTAREGVRLKAYKDSVGVWTIGCGHTSAAGPPKVTPGLTITAAESDEIFARDLIQYERAVDQAVKVPLADHERDALVSVCYNIGTGAFRKSTFLKRLNAGDRPGCALAIMKFRIPHEIVPRREAERDQFLVSYDVSLPKARSNDARPIRMPGAARKFKPTPVVVPLPVERPSKTLLLTYQQRLKDLGFYGLKVDGLWGNGTAGAIAAFKDANGLGGEAVFDAEMVSRLMSDNAKRREIADTRKDATAADIRDEAPIVRKAEKSETAAVVQGAIPAVGGIAYYAAQAVEWLRPIREFLEDIPVAVWVGGVVALAVYLWWQSRSIKAARVAMHRNAEVA